MAHLTFVIHGAPKVMLLTVDFHEHLVQMPPPWAGFQTGNSAFSERQRETNVQHHHQADDFAARFKIAE
jgi:hypothetical protein